jgi:hypothetical protein
LDHTQAAAAAAAASGHQQASISSKKITYTSFFLFLQIFTLEILLQIFISCKASLPTSLHISPEYRQIAFRFQTPFVMFFAIFLVILAQAYMPLLPLLTEA